MFEFFKKIKENSSNEENTNFKNQDISLKEENIESKEENIESKEGHMNLNKENVSQGDTDMEDMEEVDTLSTEPVTIQDVEPSKFIIKEDAKVMSIPCNHKNYLPQTLLKIDKTLITNPDNVAIHLNLGHLDSVDSIEEGFKQIIDIQDPCGGTGTIQGEVLLEKVIIVGGVDYSIIMYDTVTQGRVYAGSESYKTAYTIYKVAPFGVEVEIDPKKVKPVFTVSWKRLPDQAGVDYYLYTVDGEVELIVLP